MEINLRLLKKQYKEYVMENGFVNNNMIDTIVHILENHNIITLSDKKTDNCISVSLDGNVTK
jgi:hypothetical protein